jgi:predicted nucleotidyltransferase
MPTQKASEIINKIKKILEKDNRVVALVLVGSQARKTGYKASSFSDIEMYIFVKDKTFGGFKKDLESLPSKVGNAIFTYNNQWAGFSGVFENLQRLELPLIKISEAKNILSRPIQQEVKVLFDKGESIEKILKTRPKSIDCASFFKNQYEDFWYMAIYTAQAIGKGEYWLARQAMSVSLHPIIIRLMELYLKPEVVNLEDRKRIEEVLSDGYLEILKEISSAYDKQSIVESFQKTLKAFSKVVRETADKQSFIYDEKKDQEIFSKIDSLIAQIKNS